MEEKKDELKKDLKFNKKQKLFIAGAVAVSSMIGFKYGVRRCQRAFAKAIQACWDVDPTLKEHMWKALFEAKCKN